MKDKILKLLGRKDYAPANVPEILQQLRLPSKGQQELQEALRVLTRSGQITRTKGNRYILSIEADLIPGRIKMNRQGTGYLQPDDAGLKEIMVPESATGTAFHEDRVLVRRDVKASRPGGRSLERETGAVVRILERKRTQMVGTLKRSREFLYVIPDDPRIPHDIYVPKPRDVGRSARADDKVVVELRDWESRHTNPEGEIIEVLGAPGKDGVDMLSVLRQYDLPLHFPKNVLHAARSIGPEVTSRDVAGRTDCRKHVVVTIDPDDAKDFDDAFCLQRVSSDEWKLWVHIADVSNYVQPGSVLDVEARKRGNSTYLVDRVIPMLPEALSNELCSLKPNVDRLTKCVEFRVSNDGRILSSKFYPAVIHSQQRFTYKEAFAVLNRKAAGRIEQMLHHANTLAQRIRRLRFKNGSLALDFPETKIRLDDKGRVLCLEKVENDVSHQLIEEFMLMANEAVAGHLISRNVMAIHRVHEEPEERRLQEYREEVLSHHVPCGNLSKPAEVQKLLRRLDTLSIGPALKIGFLKSLMRARYAVESLGHYGLAKKQYTHFTSPIRRYADLVVHRALFAKNQRPTHSLRETADHISTTERNSSDAERDSKDVKMYAFLKAQLQSEKPERYSALVTDVRNFGFFVDVPGLAMSGLVHLSSLTDDFYLFDPARSQLTGRRNRRVIRLGDNLNVEIFKVDTFKKQVDFKLVAEPGKQRRPAGGRSKPTASGRGKPTPAPAGRKASGGPARKAEKPSARKPRRRPTQQSGGRATQQGSHHPTQQGAGGQKRRR